MNPFQYEVGTRVGIWPDREPVEVIGRSHGGFGAVYIIRGSDGRVTALKTIRADLASSEVQRQEFADEAALWAKLPHHPNILPLYGVRRYNGMPHVEMEYVAGIGGLGSSAEDLLIGKKPGSYLTAAFAAYLVTQLLEALVAVEAESPEFSHGDIKPANVMLAGPRDTTLASSSGAESVIAKLTDFGLSRANGSSSAPFGGDIRYLSPEALVALDLATPFEGYKNFSGYGAGARVGDLLLQKRRDIYALGCTAFELVYGRPCQLVDPIAGTVLTHAYLGARDPENYFMIKKTTAPLVLAIETMLAADPAERPNSFNEARLHWRRAVEGMGLTFPQYHSDGPKPPSLSSLKIEHPRIAYLVGKRGLPREDALEIIATLENASTQRNSGDTLGSLAALIELDKRIKGFAPVHADMAYTLMVLGKHDVALNAYLFAYAQYHLEPVLLRDDLGFGACCSNMALLITDSGSLPEHPDFLDRFIKGTPGDFAIKVAREAIQALPRSAQTHSSLGVALMAFGSLTEALHECTIAYEIDPQRSSSKAHLAACLLMRKEANAATSLSLNEQEMRDAVRESEGLLERRRVLGLDEGG